MTCRSQQNAQREDTDVSVTQSDKMEDDKAEVHKRQRLKHSRKSRSSPLYQVEKQIANRQLEGELWSKGYRFIAGTSLTIHTILEISSRHSCEADLWGWYQNRVAVLPSLMQN